MAASSQPRTRQLTPGEVAARDLTNHESAAVSRNYTHIDAETKRTALGKLPDVTAPANPLKGS